MFWSCHKSPTVDGQNCPRARQVHRLTSVLQPKSKPPMLTPANLTPVANAGVNIEARAELASTMFENMMYEFNLSEQMNVVVNPNQGLPQDTKN